MFFSFYCNFSAAGNFDPAVVINILLTYDGGENGSAVRKELSRFGLSDYPFALVMPAASKSLHAILSTESIAGKDWKSIKTLTESLIRALIHVHQKGAFVYTNNNLTVDL